MSSSETIAIANNDRMLLFVLSMSVFFVGASEFMLSAMLNPLSVAFNADTVSIAWLVSSYAFAYAIAAPFLGYLSDRIDRGRLLLIALLSFAIDGVGIAFSPTLGIAVALRWARLRSHYSDRIRPDFRRHSARAPCVRDGGGHAGHDARHRARSRDSGTADRLGRLASTVRADVGRVHRLVPDR